ncbi:hypothetical protein ACRAWD_31390 [Caulobacter segnis]
MRPASRATTSRASCRSASPSARPVPPEQGDKAYDPLFAYGYGLSYARPGKVGKLSESLGRQAGGRQRRELFRRRQDRPRSRSGLRLRRRCS